MKNTDRPKKKDLDKLFAERNNKNAGLKNVDTAGMTDAKKGMVMQMAQENVMLDDLLDNNEVEVKLNSEDDYKAFGKKTAGILYGGSCPYRIESFCSELFRELPEHCNSKQINEIIRRLQAIQYQLQKDEKSKNTNKKKEKPKLKLDGKADKQGGYERNNNIGMVNDVMGNNADDVGDEYGDYGDEGAFRRENEADYDFM